MSDFDFYRIERADSLHETVPVDTSYLIKIVDNKQIFSSYVLKAGKKLPYRREISGENNVLCFKKLLSLKNGISGYPFVFEKDLSINIENLKEWIKENRASPDENYWLFRKITADNSLILDCVNTNSSAVTDC